VIAAWRIRTKNFKEDPEFYLIIRARNQILKDGSFASYASSFGELNGARRCPL
jgi:hypothetical protein